MFLQVSVILFTGGGCLVPGVPDPGDVWSREGVCWSREGVWSEAGLVPGGVWSWGCLVPGVRSRGEVPGPGGCLVPGGLPGPGGCLVETPWMATAVGSTHPTGMHSC